MTEGVDGDTKTAELLPYVASQVEDGTGALRSPRPSELRHLT
jgi:hypothetical protein